MRKFEVEWNLSLPQRVRMFVQKNRPLWLKSHHRVDGREIPIKLLMIQGASKLSTNIFLVWPRNEKEEKLDDLCSGEIFFHFGEVRNSAKGSAKIGKDKNSSYVFSFPDIFHVGKIDKISAVLTVPDDDYSILKEQPNLADTGIRSVRPKSLGELLREDQDSFDFTIISKKDGSSHSCHKLVMTASSEYFKARVRNSLEETNGSSTAELNVGKATALIILDFIYLREIDLSQVENISEILDTAKMLFLHALVDNCEETLIKRISLKNAWDFLLMARQYDLGALKMEAFKILATDSETAKKMEKLNDVPLFSEFVAVVQMNTRQPQELEK